MAGHSRHAPRCDTDPLDDLVVGVATRPQPFVQLPDQFAQLPDQVVLLLARALNSGMFVISLVAGTFGDVGHVSHGEHREDPTKDVFLAGRSDQAERRASPLRVLMTGT